MSPRRSNWKRFTITPAKLALARVILEDIRAGMPAADAIQRHPQPEGGFVGKNALVYAYRELAADGQWAWDPAFLRRIRMKPSRTLSGVTTVTVLTKPYPCPGKCVFCPTDVRMPKSYLPDEPGAMRALQNEFDPYRQTASRLQALYEIGHPTAKIELLILGGTWSAYRRDYQAWFIQRCLDAMNGFASADLAEAQAANEQAEHRNVGLVIETRPDHVDREEIAWLRALGVTKVQIGVQSLDDGILALNQRGHTVDETRQAARLLRAAGFKIVMHWMPNLLGASLASDEADFARLWADPDLRPDELKIYPNQLLEQAELYTIWEQGGYRPYTTEELIELLVKIKPTIPRYCRVNRVIRDFPSTHVVEGNRRTSLRQDVHRELARRGLRCSCIRCREIRGQKVEAPNLTFHDLTYAAGAAEEHFLSFTTADDRLAGFLRLSLPGPGSPDIGLPDLTSAGLIREIHVYGQSLDVGQTRPGIAQHAGLGRRLLEHAEALAVEGGFQRMAVISALGTRGYYADLGYHLGQSYMVKPLL
jgi:elongator complex protein 3 (tRNA carboxymethyluridine synthase)